MADRQRARITVVIAVIAAVAVVVFGIIWMLDQAGPRPVGTTVAGVADTTPMGTPVAWAGVYSEDVAPLIDGLGQQGADAAAITRPDAGDGFFHAYQYNACTERFGGWWLVGDRIEPQLIDLNRECYRPQYSVVVGWFTWSDLPAEITIGKQQLRQP